MQEEEEYDPGKIGNGFLAVGEALGGGVQIMEDGDWEWSNLGGGERVLACMPQTVILDKSQGIPQC